jgi:uncharacterized protein
LVGRGVKPERAGSHSRLGADPARSGPARPIVVYSAMHWLLVYEVTEDYLERRALYRTEHLGMAWKACGRGELLLGGALGDPVESAVLLFSGEGPEAAESFARADPYVREGLVKSWRVLKWNTVVGEGAAAPVRP